MTERTDVADVQRAIADQDMVALDRLLQADPDLCRLRERWGDANRECDLLTHLSSVGSVAMVDVLLDHGVQSQVSIPDVFAECFRSGQLRVADHLLQKCDVEIHHLQEQLYQLTEDLNVEGVAWLLDHGADPDYRRAGIRWTPLHNCLHTYPTKNRNRQQITRLLIKAGADHDDNVLYDLLSGQRERLQQRLHDSPDLLQMHFDLRGGRDIEIERRGEYGGAPISNTTLLHHCAEFGWREEAELLLSLGADPNARARPGKKGSDTHTPIYHTLTTNNNVSWDVLNLLLDSGADVNVRANIDVGEVLEDVSPLGFMLRFPHRYWKSDPTGEGRGSLDTVPHPEVVDLLKNHGARE
jgi:hypothetical protein